MCVPVLVCAGHFGQNSGSGVNREDLLQETKGKMCFGTKENWHSKSTLRWLSEPQQPWKCWCGRDKGVLTAHIVQSCPVIYCVAKAIVILNQQLSPCAGRPLEGKCFICHGLCWALCDVPNTQQWDREAPSLRDSGCAGRGSQNSEPAQVLEGKLGRKVELFC